MAERFVGLNPAQANRIARGIKKIEGLPANDAAQSSFWGNKTGGLIGKLTSTVTRNDSGTYSAQAGTFQSYCAPNPDDNTSVEVSTGEDPLTVWPWHFADNTSLPSGTRVVVDYMAGRWYVVGAETCPS